MFVCTHFDTESLLLIFCASATSFSVPENWFGQLCFIHSSSSFSSSFYFFITTSFRFSYAKLQKFEPYSRSLSSFIVLSSQYLSLCLTQCYCCEMCMMQSMEMYQPQHADTKLPFWWNAFCTYIEWQSHFHGVCMRHYVEEKKMTL